jgi:dolichyl-phosphate-mannose--protein O-mannosyl transferase
VSETRWYASTWWEWPLIVRPIWLYAGEVDVPPGMIRSIVTMGNPALWWVGFAGVLVAAGLLWWRLEPEGAFTLFAFLCQYLPWLLVPRSLLFIYHFFSAVPFMALTLAYAVSRLTRRSAGLRAVGLAYVTAAALLFALFYPILAGVSVPAGYVRFLTWFPTWIFHA